MHPHIAPQEKQLLRDTIATFVRDRVREGVYRPGDRVPSVRELSKMLDVSVSTVVDAYRSLETEGTIFAQPQSGFYVPLSAFRATSPLKRTQPEKAVAHFTDQSLFMRVMRDATKPGITCMAVATPATEALPAKTLHRLLVRAVRENAELAIAYDVSPGYRPLREQIARRSLASGCVISPDELVVTTGCSEALSLSLRAVCKPGDIVAVESPTYYGVLHVIAAHGLQVLEIATDPATGMCLDSLRRAMAEFPIKAVLATPSFSNPMGSFMPTESKKELVELLAQYEIPLIEDDIYGDLAHNGERQPAAKAFDRTGNVILCSSFSKTVAPGYRVGWVSGGRYHGTIEELKFAFSVANATAPQIAMAEYIQHRRYPLSVRRISKTYGENLFDMRRTVLEHFPKGTVCSDPVGGFVLWVRLPGDLDALDLYGRAIQEGVAFMPGVVFSAHDSYRSFLRLNASRWDAEIDRAVQKLGALAHSMWRE